MSPIMWTLCNQADTAAPKNIQAAVYHLSAYWEKKKEEKKNNLPYWTVSSPQDKQPCHIIQELQLSPV